MSSISPKTNQSYTRQLVRIADKTGSLRVTCFGKMVNRLKNGGSYNFLDLKKDCYQGRVSAVLGFGSHFCETTALTEVNEDEGSDDEQTGLDKGS